MIKIFFTKFKTKFKELNFTNHWEQGRGSVGLLIKKIIWGNFSLSRSVIKPGRDQGDEFRVHVKYV